MQKTNTINDGVGSLLTFIFHFFLNKVTKRSIPYYYNIPILRLPKLLRKIPGDFRETFQREYSYEIRLAILCRIYRDPNFISDITLKEHWKKQQRYSKVLLKYLDDYWNVPKKDRIITPELMKKLKTVPVNAIINKDVNGI